MLRGNGQFAAMLTVVEAGMSPTPPWCSGPLSVQTEKLCGHSVSSPSVTGGCLLEQYIGVPKVLSYGAL